MIEVRHKPLARLLAVAALLFGVVAATATATTVGAAGGCDADTSDYGYGATATLTTPGQASPGSTVTIEGTGFPPGCEVAVVVAGATIQTVTVGEDGSFTASWAVPADQELGEVVVDALVGGEVLASTVITIVEAQPAGGNEPGDGNGGVAPAQGGPAVGAQAGNSGTLPATGSKTLPLVFGGLALLVLGTGMVLAKRRFLFARGS